MATIYVRSTDGSNADNGSTWALAKQTLVGADGIDVAGDTIYVSQNHAESTAGAVSISYAGTPANPTRLVCGNDANQPPTAVATSATVTTTTNGGITLSGCIYCYGITFIADGSTTINNGATAQTQFYENCSFQTTNTGSGGAIGLNGGNNATYKLNLLNCTFKFNGSGQVLTVQGTVTINGGSVLSGSVTPTVLFRGAFDRANSDIQISGFDLSNLASTVHIFNGTSVPPGRYIIRNSKFPASWSGSLVNGTIAGPGPRFEMYNCDSGDTNYKVKIEDYTGTLVDETTVVRTSGASDGTTPISWKVVTTANAKYPDVAFETPEIVKWNETTGSSLTATIEVVTDNVTLTDAECWLEVQYLGTSGFPLSTFVRDVKADILASAANQTSSSVSWTTTGLTTPVKQKLNVTFTPQEKGFIHAVVKVAKASTTVYIDPLLTVA